MSHTNEPWDAQFHETAAGTPFGIIVGGRGPGGLQDTVICHSPDFRNEPISFKAFKAGDARRIVACVNACKGSSTEWLEFQISADRVEQFGPPEPFETRYTKELQKGLEYMEQRDSLLAALRSAKHMLTRDYIDDAKMAVIEKCDTVITQVTGREEI